MTEQQLELFEEAHNTIEATPTGEEVTFEIPPATIQIMWAAIPVPISRMPDIEPRFKLLIDTFIDDNGLRPPIIDVELVNNEDDDPIYEPIGEDIDNASTS